MSCSIEAEEKVAFQVKKEKTAKTCNSVGQETKQKTTVRSGNDEDAEEIARVEKYQSKPFFRRYFFECIYALYIYGTALNSIPLNTLMNEKSCMYQFGFNESLCSELQRVEASIKNPVLAYTNTYSTLQDVVTNVPAGLAAVVAGNYLTRYGFRIPLLTVIIGAAVTCALQLLTALIMPAPLIFNALAEIPGSIAGGSIVMSTTAFTNIALRVPQSLHLSRITAASICGGTAALFAIFSGTQIATAFGVKILLGICIVILSIPTFLVLFFLEDIEVPEENKKDSWCASLWLSLKNGLETSINAVSLKRPERRRTQIICAMICFAACSVGIPASAGAFAIAYTRSVLKFSPSQYALYSGGTMLISFACIFPLIILSKKLKLSPPLMIAVGSAFFAVKLAMLTLTQFFHFLFYIQILVGIPYALAPLSQRSYITSLVEKSEVSVVMALLSLIEKFVPLATGLLGSYIFTLTSVSFPGCFYLILTFVYFIPIGLGLYCALILRWNKRDKEEAAQL